MQVLETCARSCGLLSPIEKSSWKRTTFTKPSHKPANWDWNSTCWAVMLNLPCRHTSVMSSWLCGSCRCTTYLQPSPHLQGAEASIAATTAEVQELSEHQSILSLLNLLSVRPCGQLTQHIHAILKVQSARSGSFTRIHHLLLHWWPCQLLFTRHNVWLLLRPGIQLLSCAFWCRDPPAKKIPQLGIMLTTCCSVFCKTLRRKPSFLHQEQIQNRNWAIRWNYSRYMTLRCDCP